MSGEVTVPSCFSVRLAIIDYHCALSMLRNDVRLLRQ